MGEARATLAHFTFTCEYFIGHKKHRSTAVGCKLLKFYGDKEMGGQADQEGTPGEKGQIRKDEKASYGGKVATRATRHEGKRGREGWK